MLYTITKNSLPDRNHLTYKQSQHLEIVLPPPQIVSLAYSQVHFEGGGGRWEGGNLQKQRRLKFIKVQTATNDNQCRAVYMGRCSVHRELLYMTPQAVFVPSFLYSPVSDMNFGRTVLPGLILDNRSESEIFSVSVCVRVCACMCAHMQSCVCVCMCVAKVG